MTELVIGYDWLWGLAVANRGFSRGGAPTPKLGLFCNFFGENCMKLKEFEPLGGVPGTPLRCANVLHISYQGN